MDSMKEFLESPLSLIDNLRHETMLKDEDAAELKFESSQGFSIKQLRSQHNLYKKFMVH